MDVNNSQSGNVKCGSVINNTWKRRSKLEKKLIIVLIIVTLLLIGILLFVIIKHAAAPKICKTTACILAASQIVSHVDPSADPCEDFFQFACGNFIKNSHGDIQASSIKQMEEKVERQIAEIIREPIKEDDNQWLKSQKALLEACMNESAVEEDTMSIVKETLEELNGWPVTMGNRHWNERLFDWKYMISKLREKGYPYLFMLGVAVIPDKEPNNTNRYIISVYPPYISKIKNEMKESYKTNMTDLAVLFGADRKRAATEMENVFNFMEDLRKIYDEKYLAEDNENETEANPTAAFLKGRVTVRRYQELNGEIDWLDFINTILYPVGKITIDDYVMFPKLKYTEAFFRLIYRTDRRVLANYIIWRVVEKLMPYMPKKLGERETNYAYLMDISSTNLNSRFEFCNNKIMSSYRSLLPSDITYARKYLPIDHRKKVEQIFANVKSELVSALQRASWMDTESRTKALEKARSIVEIIGAPGNYFDDAVFKQLLGDNYTDVENDSFLTMLLKRKKIQTDMSFFKMHMNVNDTGLDEFYTMITTVNALCWIEKNAVLLPAAILQGIFFNVDRPMYLNYGAIGSIIGHELAHGFGVSMERYEQENKIISIWTNETLKAYKEKTECIVKEADEFLMDDTESQINGTTTLEENLADYTGVKMSYAAYKNWIDQNGKEPKLPEIIYTPNQLFWISAVSYECFKKNKYSELKKDVFHAHSSFRATAPLRNNPHFANDFNCPVGSKMNPPKKCQVF